MFLVKLFQQKISYSQQEESCKKNLIQLMFSKTMSQVNMKHYTRVAILLIRSLSYTKSIHPFHPGLAIKNTSNQAQSTNLKNLPPTHLQLLSTTSKL